MVYQRTARDLGVLNVVVGMQRNERLRAFSRRAWVVAAAVLSMAMFGAGSTVSMRAIAAPPSPLVASPPTLDDYWDGSASWKYVRRYQQPQFSTPDDKGYGAGTHIRVGPDGAWYWFYRTSAGFDTSVCPELAATGLTATVVRRSADKGVSWGPATTIAVPTAGTPWACHVTDGDAIWTGARWEMLVQCEAKPGAPNGWGVWNICHFWNDNVDATVGPWVADPTNPVIGDNLGDPAKTVWPRICDDPADDCVRMPGGPNKIFETGTPSFFTVPSDPGYTYVDVHGVEHVGNEYAWVLGNQYVGVFKTKDFRTFEAGSGPFLPTDAIYDRLDAEDWLEPAPAWKQNEIGGGGGSVYYDPITNRWYHVVETSNAGAFGCTTATVMDIGILRADSPSATSWDQPSSPNPILYSDDPVFTDQNFPIRCFPSYVALFGDPGTGDTYLTVWNADYADQADTAVYLYKLERNLLKNGDASRCVEVAPFEVADGSLEASSVAVLRHGEGSSDGKCYFAMQRDIQQDIPLNRHDLPTSVRFGGKFKGRSAPLPQLVTGTPWSRNLETLGIPARLPRASGVINVQLSEMDARGGVIAVHDLSVSVTGDYPSQAVESTAVINKRTRSLRYRVSMGGNAVGFTLLADEMAVSPQVA